MMKKQNLVNSFLGLALTSINVLMQNVRFLANFITEAGIIIKRSKVSSDPLLGSIKKENKE